MIDHPFLPDITGLSIDDLQEKISELQNRRPFIYKTGRFDMLRQIDMVISNYQQEYQKRQATMMEELNKKYGKNTKIE